MRKSSSPPTTSVGVLYLPSAAAYSLGEYFLYSSGCDHGGPPNSQSINQSSSVAPYWLTKSYDPAWLIKHLNRSVRVAIQSTMYPPNEPPAAASCLPSINGYFAIAASTPFMMSSYTVPPQSRLTSASNFSPYPGEPRGLIITTTYPGEAIICWFHR